MSANLGAEGKIGPQLYRIYCKPLFLGNKFDSDGFPVRLIRFKICVQILKQTWTNIEAMRIDLKADWTDDEPIRPKLFIYFSD